MYYVAHLWVAVSTSVAILPYTNSVFFLMHISSVKFCIYLQNSSCQFFIQVHLSFVCFETNMHQWLNDWVSYFLAKQLNEAALCCYWDIKSENTYINDYELQIDCEHLGTWRIRNIYLIYFTLFVCNSMLCTTKQPMS
jgi:hypothetical protein